MLSKIKQMKFEKMQKKLPIFTIAKKEINVLSKLKLMAMLLGVMVFALLLANVVMAEEAKVEETKEEKTVTAKEAKKEKAEMAKEEEELAFDLGKVVITGTKTEKRLADKHRLTHS